MTLADTLATVVPGLALAVAGAPNEAPVAESRRWRAGLTYTTDLMVNAAGGVDRGAAWLGRVDATLAVEGEIIGLPGASLFLDLIYTHGPGFSDRFAGDAQVVSNVQGDGILRPYEAYLEVPVGAGWSAKAGLIDLNTEFDVQSVGAFFTNSSHGIGIDLSQSGRNGPSIFPVTSVAAMVRWQNESRHIRAGLFNAVAGDPDRPERFRRSFPGRDGALLIGEAGVALSNAVRVQLGGWTYTSREPVVDAPDRRAGGSRGAYAMVEARLAGDRDGGALEAWARAGTASPRTNRVTAYVGGGVTFGTERRRIGIAVAHARQSGRAATHFAVEEGPQRRAETSFELGYAAQLAEFLSVQPIAHYVINSGWRADVPHALILGLRFSLSVER